MAQALDPIRLLHQLEHLQQALWRHAVVPGTGSVEAAPDSTLHFSVLRCAEQEIPAEGVSAAAPVLLKKRRKDPEQGRRPHDWRTRKDPFEGAWELVTSWLLTSPERTGVEIFHELQLLYPGRFRPTQVRTLQRGIQKIRAHLLLTFDDQWGEEVVNGAAPVLRAEVAAGVG